MMRRFYLLILVYLPGVYCYGQYTYFNERLQPGQFYFSSTCNTLFEKNSHLYFTTILLDNGILNYSRAEYDHTPNLLDVKSINYTDTAFFSGTLDNSMVHTQDGSYLHAGGLWSNTSFLLKSHALKMNQNHEIIWDYHLDEYGADSFIKSFYQVPAEFADGSIVLTGYVAYDDTPQTSEGNYTSMLLTKLSHDGQLIWHHEYFMGDLFPVETGSVTPNGIFEMANGDILVFGNYWPSTRPIVLRFDSSGNYLSYASWGAPWVPGSSTSLDEAIANPVRTGEYTFVIPYGYELSEPHPSGYIIHKLRLAVFDSQTMSVSLDDELEYADLELGIRDFVRTSDNGFAMLGQRTIMNFGNLGWESYQEAFLLKFDTNRQVEWLKTYQPIVPEDDPNWYNYGWFITQDLLVTSDGGLAFLGEVMPEDQSELYAWLVKLDACGDVVFNGCPPPVGVAENAKSTGLLLYPNPAINQLNIILPPGGNRAEVYSLSGQLVLSQYVYPGWDRAAIDVSGLAGGMYMVRVVRESGDVLGTGRFVRE